MNKAFQYVSRDEAIVTICRGQRVLHLGCVGFTDCPIADKVRLAGESLHRKLTDISECVGVDLDAESVRQLKEQGVFNNVLVGDVEKLQELPDMPAFDVIVAGDIIEHVSNPGLMLEGAKRWLKPTGKLIVSTPNAFGALAFARFVTGKFREGNQHVLCFNPITLRQLLQRHGYAVSAEMTCYQGLATKHPLFRLGRFVFRAFPKFGGTLFYVCVR